MSDYQMECASCYRAMKDEELCIDTAMGELCHCCTDCMHTRQVQRECHEPD